MANLRLPSVQKLSHPKIKLTKQLRTTRNPKKKTKLTKLIFPRKRQRQLLSQALRVAKTQRKERELLLITMHNARSKILSRFAS